MFETRSLSLLLVLMVGVAAAENGDNPAQQGLDGYGSAGATVSSGKTSYFHWGETTQDFPTNFSKPTRGTRLRGVVPVKETIEQTGRNDRNLPQATTIQIHNDCGYDAFSYSVYQVGENKYGRSWPVIEQGSFLAFQGVTQPIMWVYGIRVNNHAERWKSSSSEYCWSSGDCFVKIDFGSLSGGTRQYYMCGNNSNPPPTPPLTPLPTPVPTPTPQPISAAPPAPSPGGEAAQWLTEHNSRRTKFYAQHGKGPVDLKWANSLAASAQNYANTLIGRSGCQISHGYNGDGYGGENLAANWGPGAQARSISDVMTAWYDEEINLPDLSQKGHATQVVWRSSRYLGCGQAEKGMGNGETCFIQVCRYIANGNCFADTNNWLRSVLSKTISIRHCSGDQCESLEEGCF